MAVTSEPLGITPAELDAVTGALALQLVRVCVRHPSAVAMIALARAQASIVAIEPDQEHALSAAHQMLRLYHHFIVSQGKTVCMPMPALVQ